MWVEWYCVCRVRMHKNNIVRSNIGTQCCFSIALLKSGTSIAHVSLLVGASPFIGMGKSDWKFTIRFAINACIESKWYAKYLCALFSSGLKRHLLMYDDPLPPSPSHKNLQVGFGNEFFVPFARIGAGI